MDNKILDEIKTIAIEKLNTAYGYCGCAENSKMAMLNSSNGKGEDISIIFRLICGEADNDH